MVKKLMCLMVLCTFYGAAQDEPSPRKGKFLFDAGAEYRITPIYKSPNVVVYGPADIGAANLNRDLQNSGAGIHLGMEYFLGKNLSLGFSNTLRYDHIVYGDIEFPSSLRVAPTTYGLLLDYHLYAKYYFRLFGKGDFFVGAGFSLMNTNSDFNVKTDFFEDDGTYIATVFTPVEFAYFANKLETGYTNHRMNFNLGIYITSTTDYFTETTTFIVPFARVGFNLGRL